VKVADFGLSKFSNEITFEGIIGTPSYIPPEMLNRVKDIKLDKVDVYAFGILVNELITEEIPYYGVWRGTIRINFSDLKEIVLGGEKPGVNRPNIDEKINLVLKNMILKCWSTDPEKRDSFTTLKQQKAWERAKNESAHDGEKIHDSIRRLFDIKPTVTFETFINKMSDVLDDGVRLCLDPKKVTPEIRLLKYLLEIGNPQFDQVQLSKVERLLKWCSKMTKKDYLNYLYKLCTEPYFFGIMTEPVANELLTTSKSKGKYLLRWSDDKKKSWVLDYIDKNNKFISEGIITHNISDLLKLDLQEKLKSCNLKKDNYLKQGRPVALNNLKIKEKKLLSTSKNYTFFTEVNDKNFNYYDL